MATAATAAKVVLHHLPVIDGQGRLLVAVSLTRDIETVTRMAAVVGSDETRGGGTATATPTGTTFRESQTRLGPEETAAGEETVTLAAAAAAAMTEKRTGGMVGAATTVVTCRRRKESAVTTATATAETTMGGAMRRTLHPTRWTWTFPVRGTPRPPRKMKIRATKSLLV